MDDQIILEFILVYKRLVPGSNQSRRGTKDLTCHLKDIDPHFMDSF